VCLAVVVLLSVFLGILSSIVRGGVVAVSPGRIPGGSPGCMGAGCCIAILADLQKSRKIFTKKIWSP